MVMICVRINMDTASAPHMKSILEILEHFLNNIFGPGLLLIKILGAELFKKYLEHIYI